MGIVPPPRLSALKFRHRSVEILWVSFPRNVERILGRFGGMIFHAAMYVSFTLSSASSRKGRILFAIEKQ